MTGRTFRVFISSTFSDLVAERNALARWVFPKLKAFCQERGYRFQAVDLRWGIAEEAGADQRTVPICLEEIRRCRDISPRPNFLVLLGDRYGWRPPPSVISEEDLERMRPHLEQDPRLSERVFADKGQGGWYRRDENAQPPEYVLRPRREAPFDDYDRWTPVERELREGLARAANAVGIARESRHLHGASATELEILEGALDQRKVPDAGRHVFAFFRAIRNRGAVETALADAAAQRLLDVRDGGAHVEWDRDSWARLEALKVELESRLGAANVWRYEAVWHAGGTVDIPALGSPSRDPGATGTPELEAETLCGEVWRRLSRVITEEMNRLDAEAGHPVDRERARHESFGRGRIRASGPDGPETEFFRGREVTLAAIQGYLEADVARPLVLFGPSGSGKSAVMAKALAAWSAAHANAVCVQRYIGTASGSAEIRPLLVGLSKEISRRLEGAEDDVPSDFGKVINDFPERLKRATPGRPLVVFLDALDQLGDADDGRRLRWLPRELPPHVRLVVSTLPDDELECLPALRGTLEDDAFVALPALASRDADEVLGLWLDAERRGLTTAQRAEVLEKFKGNGLPLYLKLAFEEAKKWRSYDGVPAAGLAGDVPGLVQALFERLSEPQHHGRAIVAHALGCLGAARFGLAEDEILDLLWQDAEARGEFEARHRHHALPEDTVTMPPVVWSRLYFDLRPYLAERDVQGARLLTFHHRQIAHGAGNRRFRSHGSLADHFASRWRSSDRHALLELPWQQARSERWEAVADTLGSLEFIETKVRAGLAADLVDDYARALRVLPEGAAEAEDQRRRQETLRRYASELVSCARKERDTWSMPSTTEVLGDDEIDARIEASAGDPSRLERLKAFAQFVRGEAHALARYGGLAGFTAQQAFNSARDGPVAASSSSRLQPEGRTWIALKHRPRYNPFPAQIRVLEGHAKPVETVAVSADGTRALSAGYDRVTRIWDLESGRCLRVLGDRGRALSADGRFVLAGDDADGSLCLWDVDSGGRRVLEAPRRQPGVSAAALSACGTRGLSGHHDGTLRLWDLESGRCLRVIQRAAAGSRTIGLVALSLDGTLALVGSGDTLHLWKAAFGGRVKETSPTGLFSSGELRSLSFPWGGDQALVAGSDGLLFVWHIVSEQRPIRVLQGRVSDFLAESVRKRGGDSTSLETDPRRRSFGWGREAARLVNATEGVPEAATDAAALSAAGSLALSGGNDGTVHVWDVASGSERKRFHGRVPVRSVAVTADGRVGMSGGSDGTVRLWDLSAGRSEAPFEGEIDDARAIAVCPDGGVVFARTREGSHLWRIDSRGCQTVNEHVGGSVLTVSFSANRVLALLAHEIALDRETQEDLEMFAAGGLESDQVSRLHGDILDNCILRLWDLRSGRCLRTLGRYPRWLGRASISADGTRAIGAEGGRLHVWNLRRGRHEAFDVGVTAPLALSSEGAVALCAGPGDRVTLWELSSGRCLRVLEGHTDTVSAAALSHDRQRALSAGRDRTLRLWDTGTGECRRRFAGHTGEINEVALAAEAGWALSGSSDHTLRLWDLESEECLAIYSFDFPVVRCARAGETVVAVTSESLIPGEGPGYRLHFLEIHGRGGGAHRSVPTRRRVAALTTHARGDAWRVGLGAVSGWAAAWIIEWLGLAPPGGAGMRPLLGAFLGAGLGIALAMTSRWRASAG